MIKTCTRNPVYLFFSFDLLDKSPAIECEKQQIASRTL